MKLKNVSPVVVGIVLILVLVIVGAWWWQMTTPKAATPAMEGGNQANPNALVPGGMRGGPGSKMFQQPQQQGGGQPRSQGQ